jgi:hypothetical protein
MGIGPTLASTSQGPYSHKAEPSQALHPHRKPWFHSKKIGEVRVLVFPYPLENYFALMHQLQYARHWLNLLEDAEILQNDWESTSGVCHLLLSSVQVQEK